jgi:hypothetical protein
MLRSTLKVLQGRKVGDSIASDHSRCKSQTELHFRTNLGLVS